MFTTSIKFKNFKVKKNTLSVKKELKSLLNENNQVICSLGQDYKNSFKKKNYLNSKNFLIIG